MKNTRYTTEKIIRILREAEGEKTIREVCREQNVTEKTFYRWRRKYGNLGVNEARRLRELEKENTELKKLLADQLLKTRVLEAVVEKKW